MKKRRYTSAQREQSAEATRERVLNAARALFARHGIDAVTIARIAKRAKVSAPTIYALYKSKAGVLSALMRSTLFGPRFQAARARLEGIDDPARLIALTPEIARAIYEGESSDLGLIRGASAFSPALRDAEQEFEEMRFAMQEERVTQLFAKGAAGDGLTPKRARDILWMYTSRDVYRLLVHERGWTPDEYEAWLSDVLVSTLVKVSAT